jgi:hypothetical protein
MQLVCDAIMINRDNEQSINNCTLITLNFLFPDHLQKRLESDTIVHYL